MRTRVQIKVWLSALALTLAACGDDKEEAAPPDNDGNGFTSPKDAGSDSASPRADAGTETDAEAETDAATGDPDAGESCEASKAEADEKDWPEGCYKCTPESSEQLLNSCATGWRTIDPENYPNGWRPGDDLPRLP